MGSKCTVLRHFHFERICLSLPFRDLVLARTLLGGLGVNQGVGFALNQVEERMVLLRRGKDGQILHWVYGTPWISGKSIFFFTVRYDT